MHWIQLNCLKSLNGSCTKPIFQIQISFRCWLSNWRCNATDDDGTERQAAATVASGHRKHISRLDESIFRTNRPQSTNWAADWYSVQRSALIASNNAHIYNIFDDFALFPWTAFFCRCRMQSTIDSLHPRVTTTCSIYSFICLFMIEVKHFRFCRTFFELSRWTNNK